jgi:uncharacterized protein
LAERALNPDFIKLACVLAFAYFVFLILLYTPVYQSIVLRPDYQPTRDYTPQPINGITPQDLLIESHGGKMHAWYFHVPNSKTIALVHHGNAGNILNRLAIAQAFINAQSSVLLYDFRGYGTSTGVATLNSILEDGLAVFDYVKTEYRYPIVINYGESIGSAVATNTDSQRTAQGLILQSGIASLPNVARNGIVLFFLYPDFIWPRPLLDNCALLAKSTTPLLIIHGTKDTLVPISNGELLNACAKSPNRTFVKLPDCGHNDVGIENCDLFLDAIGGFVKHLDVAQANN